MVVLFLVFFLFPDLTLTSIVGAKYLPSADALRILSLAFIINNYTGPCGSTLIAMGESRFIMSSTLIGAILNVTLNVTLIPLYGFVGAAIAIGS